MAKKVIKKMKRDPFAEGVDPSAGRGVLLSAYKEKAPKPKAKPVRTQTVNRAGKGNMKKKVK